MTLLAEPAGAVGPWLAPLLERLGPVRIADAHTHVGNDVDGTAMTAPGLLAGLDAIGARAELLQAGARPRKPVRTGVDALSASELRVTRLAAEGMTNRQIAQHLFVSPKTVESQLSAAYRKLDVTSRAALAAVLDPSG